MCSNACRCNGPWGGVFISPSLAYADGYVAPDGNIYYGYKSDADYSKNRIKIEVHYYSNKEDADKDENRDPLGKFVRVKYVANLNSKDNSFDRWAFRPMWWYGVPAGLTDVHNIIYSRFEKYTDAGTPSTSQPSAPGIRKDSDNVTKHYKDAKDWKSISRFYVEDPSKLKSMNGLKTLLGIDGGQNKGYDGNTAGNWAEFYAASKGMQGMFIDWESAGKRFYEMTYVAELKDDAWKNRDEHPLRFAAGVYRFAGNWHIATGQIHRAPKIADSLKNVKYPSLTTVVNANELNGTEKTSVETAIRKANENTTKHFTDLLDKIDVAKDGTATLTFHDKTTITMPGKLLVVEDKKDNVKFPPVYPAPIGVVKPESLSDADKQAIIKGFKKANKDKDFLNKVKTNDSEAYKFDNTKQELTITYTDGSTITVPYSSLVYQGATIADWAPYVVPSPIEVENPSSLSEQEKKQVTDAFDTANADLDVYNNAKKNGATPVTFDDGFKNAIITWADGSTSAIPSWQFLTKKPAAPTPQPPAPKPAEEKKTFTVDLPVKPTSVNFNPFNMKDSDLTDTNNSTQLDSIKGVLKAKGGKDSKNPNTKVAIDSVEYSVENGIGYITFKATGYENAKYPMGMFFKQKPGMQTPKETEHNPQGKTQYKYKVQPVEYEGDTANALDWVKALKQFVKSNYGKDLTNDLTVTETYVLPEGIKPVEGTQGLQRFVKGENDDNGVATIHIGDKGVLEVQGYEKGDSSPKTLFTVPASELYVKKNASGIDHTVSDLKDLAKKIRDAKKNSGVTDNDLKRAGIDASDNTINGMNDEKALRELIRKLTDAKKAEYKYNTNPYEVSNPTAQPTDNDFQAAVKQFLKANYDDSSATEKIDNLTFAANSATLTGKGWTPKAGTSCLELNSDTVTYGITTVSINNDGKSVDFKNGDTVLFTVSATDLYKKKTVAPEPAPTPDALVQMKEDAKKIIDRNPNLTPDQKQQFKDKIDQATDQKGIQDILNDANNKGKENKNNTTDPNIQQTINDNKNGGKEKKDQELKAAKEAAKNAIENLPNLSEEEKNTLKGEVTSATDIAGVNTVLDKAKKLSELNTVKKEAKEEAKKLYFLDHGTGADGNTADTHTEDAALNSVLGSTPAEDSTLKALDGKLQDSTATADDIRKALDAAKDANVKNTQKAKDAATKKLEEKKDALRNAYDALTPEQQNTAKEKYEAAIQAIDSAESSVNKATKPSEIKTALESVSTDTINAANQAIEAAKPKRDASGNDNDNAAALEKEKKEQIDRINESDLPEDKKQEAIGKINKADKLGDPTGIANRYLKAKKIDDAKQAIDNFKHLNNAQKDAFKAILKDTDASDHKNDDGTTSDDIDDVLANAANTDNAMARLEELEKKANEFKNEQGGNYSKLTTSEEDQNKKKAFDDYLSDATTLTKVDQGADKSADEVNTLYDDLLKAMRAIDPNAQSAGLKTDALQAEIDSDNTYKPDATADPAKPGNPVYNTSSKEKKAEFDKVLGEAQTVLKEAAKADISTAENESKEQKEIDAALEKLVKARLALDGVDTTDLQNEIGQESATTSSDAYKYDSEEKQNAYNSALNAAKKLIEQLTSDNQQHDSSQGGTQKPKTQAEKQKAVNEALANLQAARKALKGVAPSNSGSGDSGSTGVSDSEPTTVDKSELNLQIDSTESDIKDGNAGTSGTSSNNASGEGNSNAIKKAVEDSKEVKEADSKVAQAQANLDAALEEAKKVYEDPQATQAQVDAATLKLKTARKALEDAKAAAAKVRADVLKKLLKSKKLSKTGSNVSVIAMFASMISIAAGAIFVSKRRGISRHSNK
ncbi:GA module-containing protein [Gardnerella sp. DNF00502]|uniref:GA module-containing protein n=1 Tax=unclassified Gardnerella TaxID=2628112 RepID=UPI000C9F50BC|nr:GA module-containing protein [Gardnerella sp. KA00735]